MDNEPTTLWSDILNSTAPESMLHTAMRHVAYNLGTMVNRPINVKGLRLETIPLNALGAQTSDPEAETVAVYLLMGDELSGEAVLMLSPDDARYLADWLLEVRPGTTVRLGDLERSALAEFGNVTLSSFLNALSDLTGQTLRLSPPMVVVDMVTVIFEAVALAAATTGNELLIIETEFSNEESSLGIQFWVLPDMFRSAEPLVE